MKARRLAAILAATTMATATFALAGSPAAAEPAGFDSERQELTGTVDPDMLTAMTETFGYSTEEALDRLAVESLAAQAEPELRAQLGETFAGVWLESDSNTIHVAATDADVTVESGYRLSVVDFSESTLLKWQNAIDANAPSTGITGTHIDPMTNQVVITALPAATPSIARLIVDSDVPAEAVRTETTDQAPQTLATIRGGDAFYISGSSRCSIGFSVTHRTYGNGFVTAGHCGRVGDSVQGGNGGTGVFRGSSFPGNDYAWVDADSSWTATPYVNRWSGNVRVSNANEAATGSSVCRSGSTTGWHCGTVQAKNQTVYYSQGSVRGLTRTSVCAEPGDSGGSYITGSSAQGMTSGGSGNCRSGGTTYFQPVREALSRYSLTLVT